MAATGTPTPNLGLRIPQGTDPASVDDINYNSNLLDTKIGAIGNDSVKTQIDALNSKIKTKTVTLTSDSNGYVKLPDIGTTTHMVLGCQASGILTLVYNGGDGYWYARFTNPSDMSKFASLERTITFAYMAL